MDMPRVRSTMRTENRRKPCRLSDDDEVKMDTKIGILTDARRMLQFVFDHYAHEIYEQHGELFDEYDLAELDGVIEQIGGGENEKRIRESPSPI